MRKFYSIIIAFTVWGAISAQAQTELPLEISDTLVLDNTEGYYYSKSDIVVQAGGMLIVKENVTIKLDKAVVLKVYGAMRCEASAENPALINSLDSLHWGYIYGSNADIDLNGLQIRNADKFLNASHGSVIVKNCSVDSTYGKIGDDCIGVHYADSLHITNCDLNGNPAYPRIDAIDCDAIENGVIANNRITNFEDDGVDIGTQASNVFINDNYIYNCNFGISVGESSTVVAERNIIVGCTGAAIQSHSASKIITYNSTFYKNAKGFELHHGSAAGSAGVLTVNSCIISECVGALYTVQDHSVLEISYSLCDSDTLPGENNLFADPQFSDASAGNFTLLESSPCIDAADPELGTDKDGNNLDIGATQTLGSEPVYVKSKFLDISVFPNPCKDFMNISVSDDLDLRYYISSIDGRILMKGILPKDGNIQTASLPKALYFMSLEDIKRGEIHQMKFSKK